MIDRLLQLYGHTREHPCKLRIFGFLCRLLKRGQPLEVSVADGLRLRLDPFDHVDRALVLTNWHEPLTTRFIRLNLAAGQTALIAGAHMGYHVINAARAVGPAGRVIGCEPVPATFQRAAEHVATNRCAQQVKLCHVALGESAGVVAMTPPPRDNTGAAKVVRKDSATISVRVERVDQLLTELAVPQLDFALLDVEGYEIRALRGFGPVRPSLMVIECDPRLLLAAGDAPQQLLTTLRAMDYTTFSLGGESVAQADYYPEANIVAVHQSAALPKWV